MKGFLLVAAFILTFSFGAVRAESFVLSETLPKTYGSWQGEIHLSQLEAIMSEHIEADVQIDSLSWPYNPLYYAISYFAYEQATYNMHFTINNQHKVVCKLVLYLAENILRIHVCRSRTVDVTFYIGIKNASVGLKPFTDERKETLN